MAVTLVTQGPFPIKKSSLSRPATCHLHCMIFRHHGIIKDPQAQTKNKKYTFYYIACDFKMPWRLNHGITGEPPSLLLHLSNCT